MIISVESLESIWHYFADSTVAAVSISNKVPDTRIFAIKVLETENQFDIVEIVPSFEDISGLTSDHLFLEISKYTDPISPVIIDFTTPSAADCVVLMSKGTWEVIFSNKTSVYKGVLISVHSPLYSLLGVCPVDYSSSPISCYKHDFIKEIEISSVTNNLPIAPVSTMLN